MYNKLSQLNFVIGVFFILVSLILFGNILFGKVEGKLNLYTGIAFLIFGLFMVSIRNKDQSDH
jgi:hypothetical protein